MGVTVRQNADAQRYEALDDDELAGFTQYRERPGLIAFVHTEIDPNMRKSYPGAEVDVSFDQALANA